MEQATGFSESVNASSARTIPHESRNSSATIPLIRNNNVPINPNVTAAPLSYPDKHLNIRGRGSKFACLNLNSLAKHFEELQLSSDNLLDAIAINETKLDHSQLHIDGYMLIRKDRSRRGGGVAFYCILEIIFVIPNDEIFAEII